ncbi:hypothetical protein MRX96_018626 [Rhipicephalus microplus]
MSSSQKSDFISNAYHFLAMFGTFFVDSIWAIAGPFECLPVYQLATKDEPEPKMESAQFVCRECSMQFSGPVPYWDHLRSPKHKKSVETHRMLVEVAASGSPLNCSPDVISAAGPSAAGQPSPHIASMPLVCELCDVTTTCEDDLIAHVKGKKHKKRLQMKEVLKKLASAEISQLPLAVTSPPTTSLPSATTPPMSPPMSTMSEPQELKEENGEVIDLSCRVCGIVLFEHVGYKLEHLETEAHRKKKMQVTG